MQAPEMKQEQSSSQPQISTIPLGQDVVKLIRHAPDALLGRLLVPKLTKTYGFLETGLNGRARVRELTKRLAALDDEPLGTLVADAERIVEMTDELGQEALSVASIDRETFASQENATARSLWVFLKEPASFRRAEEIRYADNYRLGRMWDGFIGPKDALISSNPEHHREFEERIRNHFRSGHVKVEVYERTRPDTLLKGLSTCSRWNDGHVVIAENDRKIGVALV